MKLSTLLSILPCKQYISMSIQLPRRRSNSSRYPPGTYEPAILPPVHSVSTTGNPTPHHSKPGSTVDLLAVSQAQPDELPPKLLPTPNGDSKPVRRWSLNNGWLAGEVDAKNCIRQAIYMCFLTGFTSAPSFTVSDFVHSAHLGPRICDLA